jgi:hypothetical protein
VNNSRLNTPNTSSIKLPGRARRNKMNADLSELLRLLKAIKSREEYFGGMGKEDLQTLIGEAKPAAGAELATWCLEVAGTLTNLAQHFIECRFNVAADIEENTWPAEKEPALSRV